MVGCPLDHLFQDGSIDVGQGDYLLILKCRALKGFNFMF